MTTTTATTLVAELRADDSHGRWGLPGHFVGARGQALLAQGDAAVAALVPLLDDTTPLSVEGSEAATLHDAARWRLADLAAWLIAQQRAPDAGAALAAPDAAVRDATIAGLRQRLGV